MVRIKEGRVVLTLENPVTAFREVGLVIPAPPGDRYRLQPLIFEGDSNVEQFIRKIKDVATFAKWSDWYVFYSYGPA